MLVEIILHLNINLKMYIKIFIYKMMVMVLSIIPYFLTLTDTVLICLP